MILCGNCRAVSELHVFTVTYHAIDAKSGCCAECIPHFLSSLAECCFVFMCSCVGRIDGDSLHSGYFIFGHDVALIL